MSLEFARLALNVRGLSVHTHLMNIICKEHSYICKGYCVVTNMNIFVILQRFKELWAIKLLMKVRK